MNAPDVLCQIRAGVEALRTEVPAAGVSHCLSTGGAGAALSIHHSRGGAPTGHCALQLHQGTADTERNEGVGREKGVRIQSHCYKRHGCQSHQEYLHSLDQALHSHEEQVQILPATLNSHYA